MREWQARPVDRRDDEIRRAIQVLQRRPEQPVLIGEPGVGKTAIARGLAQRIVNARCRVVKDKRVLSLDMAGLLAVANVPRRFEAAEGVLKEVSADEAASSCSSTSAHDGRAGKAEGAIDAGTCSSRAARGRAALHSARR